MDNEIKGVLILVSLFVFAIYSISLANCYGSAGRTDGRRQALQAVSPCSDKDTPREVTVLNDSTINKQVWVCVQGKWRVAE